jgi:hypothetical protein
MVGGYRYLSYDFDSDFKLLKDLDVGGPFIRCSLGVLTATAVGKPEVHKFDVE